MLKFFRVPFATAGDKTAIPDAADSNGNVSYSQGYGFDYQRQKTDPAAKNIERDKMNQAFFDMTSAIAELQSQGIPDFITSALNGGTAYSYAADAVVRYSGDIYLSMVDANTALPSDATKWALLPTPERLQSAYNTRAVAGGTVDALTAAFVPAIASLPASPGTLSVLVRAGGANLTTTPTFKADATAAKTIVKGANTTLAAGDIAGAGHWLRLDYDATLDRWVLLNPATGVVPTVVPDATTSVKGKVQLATSAEVTTGTDAAKAVTPAALATAGVVAVQEATTSVKGKAALATSAEVTTGTDAAKVITPAALKNATLAQASIGFGQTYQDVTASRALATTYTNSLARPILVSVDFTIPTTAQLIGSVAGVAIAWSNSQQSGNATGLQFIVPPGATYGITISTGSPTLLKWFELK